MTDSNSLLGKTLGTCTLEYLLSQGGMGTVYLARQQRPHRVVAVKVLFSGAVFKKQAQAAFLARFRREADAIAALDHVHIMPLYEYGELDQLAYLVMPYVTGGTLRQRLLERGALPLDEALPILVQAAESLDYAHERGIIHRDIKPSNMIFHADGRLLLSDFGLAKILDQTDDARLLEKSEPAFLKATQIWPVSCHEQATRAISLLFPPPEDAEATCRVNRRVRSSSYSSETVIGTPEYLAPERALGQPVDRRADIYSLGVVLFQMLTGRVPFAGSSAISTALMHTEDEPPLPSALLPSLTPQIEAVILRALAKDPTQRYNTAGAFACALREAAENAEIGLHREQQSYT
ncbi:MAG: serine/threonine-protein kinase, partial [Ktedonobacteraceae bacterium]